MPRPQRMDRINQLILEEVASAIQNVLRDPDIGFITVVSVETAPDLKNATIFVSRLGTKEEGRKAVDALNRAASIIRREIMPHMSMRTMPKLVFKIDDTAERAERISRLLRGEVE